MKVVQSLANSLADQIHLIMLGLSAALGLMPLGLLAVSGAWFYVGVLYAAAWLALVVPSSFAYSFLLLDIWRLYKRERPTHLTPIFVETAIRIDRPQDARKHKIHWFVDISCRANPLTPFFLALFAQALAWRTEIVREMWEEARKSIVPKKAKPVVLPETTHAAEFGAELVEPLVRREHWNGPLAHA